MPLTQLVATNIDINSESALANETTNPEAGRR
jgi:hypothetical protein